jgi:hypothetical protein
MGKVPQGFGADGAIGEENGIDTTQGSAPPDLGDEL